MCMKTCSSSSTTTKPLNPSAQEWIPKNPHTKNPPKTAALSAAAPPFRLLPRVVALSAQFLKPPAGRKWFVPAPRDQRPTLQFSFFVEDEPRHLGWDLKSSGRRAAVEWNPKSSSRRAAVEWKPKNSGQRAAVEWKPKMSRRRAAQEWKPKRSRRRAAAAEFSPPSSNTTVMIKNIPNHLRRDFMLEFMDSHCRTYSLEYDFLYLPMDFRSKDNFGYAFVNFTSAQAAHNFKLVLHNFKWNTYQTKEGKFITSRKICHITWARIQGKEGLDKRFQNMTFDCDEPSYLPVFLNPPRNGSDPNPPPPLVAGKMCSKIHQNY